MFELAVLADGGGLAVALDGVARDAEGRDRPLGQEPAELLADLDEVARSST